MWAIIDTNIYIGLWERGLFEDTLEQVRKAFIVRHSAVVLSELRRGVRTREAERTVARLHRLARNIWEPTPKDWWDAGQIIQSIGDANHWDSNKRRAFQNDALIALTARGHGATVVTTNRNDFELLGKTVRVPVLVV